MKTILVSGNPAKAVPGGRPEHDGIETIIGSAWNWHKEHPHGYDD